MALTYEIGHVMTREIITIEGDSALTTAAELMIQKEIGSLVVTEQGKMAGIVTERDILKHFTALGEETPVSVRTIMSSPLITVDGGAPIGRAADIMAQKKIRRLLVTQKEKIVGIVTERDVMRATLDVFNKLSDALV